MLVVRLGLDVRLGVDRGGELTQNGMLENHPRGQRYPAISSPGSHLSREDAVAAEVEEVVVASDLPHLEHVGEDGSQRALGFGVGGLGRTGAACAVGSRSISASSSSWPSAFHTPRSPLR